MEFGGIVGVLSREQWAEGDRIIGIGLKPVLLKNSAVRRERYGRKSVCLFVLFPPKERIETITYFSSERAGKRIKLK